ncbi:hypothetical protein SO802_006485, partial [Lithocarpus litseifolius]
EDEGIVLGGDSTKAAKELGENCLVMQILTQRSINIEALRKTMRVAWKPNKSVRISDIEEDLFLVEFGDKKDKQKVLDMCPWNYEKNLVLLQDFDGDVAPKELKLRWTKKTGWKIGSKTGEVMDVDVLDNGVQWGRCLQVRVNIDITKKLVRGEKLTFKDDEQRWVYFRYERLPNFCYTCGKLGHGEKECKEDDSPTIGKEKPAPQYGAWLKGEPLKRTSNKDMPDSSHRPPEYRNHHRTTERAQPSHEARVVGEPHTTREPTRLPDTTLTHSEGSHAPTATEPVAKLASTLAKGTVTATGQKQDCL